MADDFSCGDSIDSTDAQLFLEPIYSSFCRRLGIVKKLTTEHTEKKYCFKKLTEILFPPNYYFSLS
jgi:hypothetical protein